MAIPPTHNAPCCGSLLSWRSRPGRWCSSTSLCHRGGAPATTTTQQVEYARVFATTPFGTYQQRGVHTVGTSWAAEVERARSRYAGTRRRRDVMPTRHETDFSVLEFADYPRDEAWVEFMTTSRFASEASEPPASLRALLPEFDVH